MRKLLYIICCITTLPTGAFACLNNCFCDDDDVDSQRGMVVDCSSLYEDNIPSNIPESALKLNASHNELKEIPTIINRLTNLRVLDLSHNHLERIVDNLFSNLNNLKVLNLSNNELEELTLNAFNGLSRLEKLDLHTNLISHLPVGMLQSLTTIIVVCLRDNNWDCDSCEFRETLTGYRSYEQNDLAIFCNMEEPACGTGPRTFTEVNLEEIPECPEGNLVTTSRNFVLTTFDLSTELSIVTREALKSFVGENSYKNISSIPDYVQPKESIAERTSEVGLPSNHFVSGEDVTKGDSQLLIAVAIVILGVVLFIIFLVFSIMLWKMQRKLKKNNVSCRTPSMDALGMVSPWPLLQGRQIPSRQLPAIEESMNVASSSLTDYEEIPCTPGENFDGYVKSRDMSKTESEQSDGQQKANNKGFEPYYNRIDSPDFTAQYRQPNLAMAMLPRAVDYERMFDISDTTEETDLRGNTPYVEMHSPLGDVVVKDLYAPLNT